MDTTVVIGDIHGCNQTLLQLLNRLPDSIETIYSVGDLIDRGPDSKGVVQTCIDTGIKPVKGNHEDMLMDYLKGILTYENGMFEMNGGIATLNSYGSYKNIPEDHLNFISNLPYYIETEDFIITHGGIPVSFETSFRDMSQRSKDAVMWNRGMWSVDLNKLQIFGHTSNLNVTRRPKPHKEELAWANIDTACYSGNYLTAFLLPSLDVIQVKNTKEPYIRFPSIYS